MKKQIFYGVAISLGLVMVFFKLDSFASNENQDFRRGGEKGGFGMIMCFTGEDSIPDFLSGQTSFSSGDQLCFSGNNQRPGGMSGEFMQFSGDFKRPEGFSGDFKQFSGDLMNLKKGENMSGDFMQFSGDYKKSNELLSGVNTKKTQSSGLTDKETQQIDTFLTKLFSSLSSIDENKQISKLEKITTKLEAIEQKYAPLSTNTAKKYMELVNYILDEITSKLEELND